ncbi:MULTISPECIES: MliC family protein [Neisseriaceae]|jgi:Membrane-bound lysozyme-inhibitor of c-type lysozyme.|uniref:MliC family protein n=1 Tax=Morococcus cerebrosus TaxID=1056807 RepID=A0A0C1H3N3_9NEIS|nr:MULTISPECIES: MliC family protein [Neisseriaceae]KIC13080.1 hypothetical protein MCC93_02600 [Morococcus cerebrosus]UNV86647.1 MliC family protein [Morococcus cerebrosus]
MKSKVLLAVAAALSLGACVAPDMDYDFERGSRHEHRHEHRYDNRYEENRRTSESRRLRTFSCENGLSVDVRNLNNDQLELRLDDKRAVLSSDVSGSGSRYTSNRGLFGKGAEWHEKNGEASFSFTDPYGNRVETSCSVR